MATAQLGTFSYDMVLNYAKWTDSLAKAERAANNTTKAIQQGFEKIGDSFSDLANKIIGALAVEKLVEFGAKAIETADQVGKMAQKVGLSVESLSALSAQARLSNVSTEELQVGLTKLAKTATDAAAGNKQSAASFAAIGVSLRDSNGNLKSTEQLLGDVAAKFSSYRDSATKTADAQAFFGKSGAQLIPLLNELGTDGFAKAREEAEKYGAVISGDTAKAAEVFEDNLTKLKLETEGFANAVIGQLLPSLNSLTGQMVRAGQTTTNYQSSASTFVNALKGIAVAAVATAEAVKVLTNFVLALGDSLGGVGDIFNGFAKGLFFDLASIGEAMKGNLEQAKAYSDQAGTAVAEGWEKGTTRIKTAWDNARGGVIDSVLKVGDTLDGLFGTFSNVTGGAETAAKGIGAVNAPLIENADSADKAAKALEAYNKAQLDAAKFLAQIGTGLDPVSKAYDTYTQLIIKSDQIQQQIIETATAAGKAQEGYALAVEFGMQANEAANKVLDESLAKIAKQADVVGRLQKEYDDQRALIGLTDREKAIAEAVQKATEEWQKNEDAMVKNKDSLTDTQNAARAMATANFDLTESIKNSQAVWQGWISIVMSAADSLVDDFAKAVVEGGSLLDSLANTAKQVVEQIISYFLKLAVINPILNAVFGTAISGGGSLLPTLASAGANSLLGGGSAAGSTLYAAGGAYNVGGGGLNLFGAGQTMWQGFQKGLDGFYASNGYGSSFLGTVNQGDFGNTFTPSGYTYAGAAAGGVYAGYNEYQRSGSLIGGAAYGYGTYAAGVGAAAAFSGGISAGLAAIPVVGWIAIAAILIDKFSGGKLFGTKGKIQEGSTTLNIGAGGADYATQVSLKGQKALFGGAKWSTQDIAETPEQKQAAQAFFDSMTKTMGQYAKQFGAKAGDLVNASFQQVFDKKGNPTGVTHANIGGYNYDNLTGDQFAQAYVSANELSVLDQFDSKLEDTIKTFRESVDGLNQIAAGLTNAEGYLQAGGDFLAIAGKDTLSAIVNLATGMQASGETIDQTIARLIQAQQQYDQFVGQFKPGTTYVDDFEAALADINNQMVANAAQANALAVAAGAEHASTQDLINIHNYAAKQFAAAVAQLKANANSLAASLGYALPNSLDDVDSEIAALESKAGTGASAVNGFGNAMQTAAQKATDAMNLLLGDLSPLNDQQKWQAALQGLRAGTATAQQALEIARRLFGTGADYTNAFNQVLALQHPGAVGSTGPAGGGQHGLTAAEQKRLDDLKARRDQLAAEKQHADALTLAQDVADLVGSTGESIDQALKDIGITDLPAFMKELGVTDKAAFDKFIEKLEAQTDSAGNDTASLSNDIQTGNSILADIRDGVDTLAGITPPTHSTNDDTVTVGGSGRSGSPGRGGHSGHGYQTPNDRSTRQSLDYTRTR